MEQNEKWLNWAVELQSLAQAGLFYTKDPFDKERYARIREITAEMLSAKTGVSVEKVKDIFCTDTGYQTPSWILALPSLMTRAKFCWCRRTTAAGACPADG